jgi:hypothetical protein
MSYYSMDLLKIYPRSNEEWMPWSLWILYCLINGLEQRNNQKSEINNDWFLRNPISNETSQNKIFRGRQIDNFNFKFLVVLPLYLNECLSIILRHLSIWSSYFSSAR